MQAVTITQISPNELASIIEDAVKKTFEALSPKQQPDNLSNGKRIATAQQLAKYLRRPLSAVYQMEFKGQIQAQRMPGSRKLYFDLDAIDAAMSATETKSTNQQKSPK